MINNSNCKRVRSLVLWTFQLQPVPTMIHAPRFRSATKIWWVISCWWRYCRCWLACWSIWLSQNRDIVALQIDSTVVVDEEEWSDKECRYLAQMSDPRFMTARQRSLLDKRSGSSIGIDQSLPTSDTAAAVTGKESRTPRQLGKSGDHRRAARERQREEQRATVERLLKVTPGSRLARRARQTPNPDNAASRAGPMIRVMSTQRPGCTSYVAFSDELLCPQWVCPAPPAPPALCALPGCGNRKRYRCATTGRPLCNRMACYKANLVMVAWRSPLFADAMRLPGFGLFFLLRLTIFTGFEWGLRLR